MIKTKIWRLVIASFSVIIIGIVFVVGRNSFLKKSADTNTVGDSISLTASIAYKDSGGNAITEQGKSVITRVKPLVVQTALKGRDTTKSAPTFIFNIIDPTTSQDTGSISINPNQNSQSEVDWTSLASVDPNKVVDLRIASPGFLSRRIADISLLSASSVIQSSPLIAGDINQDHKINWEDYFAWKANYGQTVSNDPGDFNGDGTIDYKDYALSFGTRCYNATESNQDNQCNQ